MIGLRRYGNGLLLISRDKNLNLGMQTSAHVEQTETKEATVKERAIEYYKDNDVAGSLEKLLNVMFLDTPEDINGYMVSGRWD